MDFNKHSELSGLHASILSPSYHHWINYDDQKIAARLTSVQAARRGTDLHNFAHEAIRLGRKQPKNDDHINRYVNDGIGFKLQCEVCLFYSINCFGHADSIGFRNHKLRVHDLKTGINQTSVRQLETYAALFCLEYGYSPLDIEIELRIYQNNEVRVYEPDPQDILYIMDRIVYFDELIEQLKREDLV